MPDSTDHANRLVEFRVSTDDPDRVDPGLVHPPAGLPQLARLVQPPLAEAYPPEHLAGRPNRGDEVVESSR